MLTVVFFCVRDPALQRQQRRHHHHHHRLLQFSAGWRDAHHAHMDLSPRPS
jgi:hypothetical protein